MRFQKGQSGNPAGKPKGAKDKRTELRALLEPHADALVAKAVSLALDGDTTALRICLERLIAPMKAIDAPLDIPTLQGSIGEQGRAVIEALSCGYLTPDQAATLMQALSAQARIMEVDDLNCRVTALEQR